MSNKVGQEPINQQSTEVEKTLTHQDIQTYLQKSSWIGKGVFRMGLLFSGKGNFSDKDLQAMAATPQIRRASSTNDQNQKVLQGLDSRTNPSLTGKRLSKLSEAQQPTWIDRIVSFFTGKPLVWTLNQQGAEAKLNANKNTKGGDYIIRHFETPPNLAITIRRAATFESYKNIKINVTKSQNGQEMYGMEEHKDQEGNEIKFAPLKELDRYLKTNIVFLSSAKNVIMAENALNKVERKPGEFILAIERNNEGDPTGNIIALIKGDKDIKTINFSRDETSGKFTCVDQDLDLHGEPPKELSVGKTSFETQEFSNLDEIMKHIEKKVSKSLGPVG